MDEIQLRRRLDSAPAQGFTVTLAWEALVLIDSRQDLGPGPDGHRFLVPILGGRFTAGPALPGFSGEIMPSGADRQILRPDGSKTLRAIYEMRVDDGTVIGIDNSVITDGDGPTRYAVSRISLTAPVGPWAILNRRFFLGSLHAPQPRDGAVIVRGWMVGMGDD